MSRGFKGITVSIVEDYRGYLGTNTDSSPIHYFLGIPYLIDQHSNPERVFRLKFDPSKRDKGRAHLVKNLDIAAIIKDEYSEHLKKYF